MALDSKPPDAGRRPRRRSSKSGPNKSGNSNADRNAHNKSSGRWRHTFAAIDLGTNNCRLLIAKPQAKGFRVIDSFSRTVRLGEGVERTGRLSDTAMSRTIQALEICAEKLSFRGVTRIRAIATEACRLAENGPEFIDRVRAATGISFDIIQASEEARLAVAGCASLLDRNRKAALIFDIGGGSTELVWMDLGNIPDQPHFKKDTDAIVSWKSLPYGVVNIAERFGGHDVTADDYAAMVQCVADAMDEFEIDPSLSDAIAAGDVHMLGTSGTVTTLAGIYLGLERYDRARVDGLTIEMSEIMAISNRLASASYDQRVAEPCVGEGRADLVIAGCAILDAIYRRWPFEKMRVADRGLREGMLLALMDKADREGRGRSRNYLNRRGRKRGKPRTKQTDAKSSAPKS